MVDYAKEQKFPRISENPKGADRALDYILDSENMDIAQMLKGAGQNPTREQMMEILLKEGDISGEWDHFDEALMEAGVSDEEISDDFQDAVKSIPDAKVMEMFQFIKSMNDANATDMEDSPEAESILKALGEQ